MAKTAMIRARIEPDLKSQAEFVLTELGLTATQAITLFYRQIALRQGLPFAVSIPNPTTLDTFRKTDQDQEVVHCQDAEEMFHKLGL